MEGNVDGRANTEKCSVCSELIPLFLAELLPDGVETSRFVWSVYANNLYLFDFDLLCLLWSSHYDRFFSLATCNEGEQSVLLPVA